MKKLNAKSVARKKIYISPNGMDTLIRDISGIIEFYVSPVTWDMTEISPAHHGIKVSNWYPTKLALYAVLIFDPQNHQDVFAPIGVLGSIAM